MNNILQIENLTFQYDEKDLEPALNKVSFDVIEGEWVSIIGHNGSGKSTTARLIDGLMDGFEGTIKIAGQTLTEENVWSLRRKIGMVFQNPDNQFVGATVEDDVAFGMENQGIPREEMIARVDEALQAVNMQGFKDKEPARLSGGQKQRVAIAGIIALRPELIILDEATSMLDPMGCAEIMSIIREIKDKYHLTVLSITHDLEEASHSDRILVMKKGKMIQSGSPREIFAREENMLEFGLDVPFSTSLVEELMDKGLKIPEEYYDDEELADLLVKMLVK